MTLFAECDLIVCFLKSTILKKHIPPVASNGQEISVKRTDDDQQFGMEFAKRLQAFYEQALADGATEKDFARRLGVDRGGLQRYLKKHAAPSLRTAVLAFREFGICVPYAGVDTLPLVSRKGRRRGRSSELQMDLPLTIEAPHGEIDIVIKKRSAQRFRLQLHVSKSG